MKRNKSKLNRYGKALGVAVIGGQVFKEKPKKYIWENGRLANGEKRKASEV